MDEKTKTAERAGAPEPRDEPIETAKLLPAAAGTEPERTGERSLGLLGNEDFARIERNSEVGSVEVDLANDLMGWRSPQYRRMHGLPPDLEHESHESWLARVHPEDRERAERVFRDAIAGSGDIYESEYRIIRPNDGKTRWIMARADILRDANGRPVRLVGCQMDVTQRP